MFLAGHPAWAHHLPLPVRSLLVGLVLFLVPAIGWLRASGVARIAGATLAAHVAVSFVLFLVSIGVARQGVIEMQAAPAWNVLWLLANVGFLIAAYRPARLPWLKWSTPAVVLGGCLFLASYGLYDWAATRVVTPQHDHDLEVQGTAVALLSRFEPLLLTDRGSVYFFAHPPLLHFHVAASSLFHGTLAGLRYYDEASQRARQSGTRETAAAEIATMYRRYGENPHSRETRAPNVFLAAVTVGLLGVWVRRLSGHWWMGALAAAAYGLNAEVLVRSSYGGYFAIGAFLSLPLLIAVRPMLAGRLRWRSTVLSGALLAIADHKTVLLPISLAASALIRSGRLLRAVLHPAVIGFLIGTGLFWTYGLLTNAALFIQDHFRHHVVDRLVHDNPLGYAGYPTVAALWGEFISHTGYVLVPAGLAFLVTDTFLRATSRATRAQRGTWLTYVLVTAAAFSIVDWRMTKHLALLIMPLVLAFAPPRRSPQWRVIAAAAGLTAVVIVGCLDLISLARDFSAYRVTPQW